MISGSLAMDVSAGVIAELEEVAVSIEESKVEPYVLFGVETAVPFMVAVAETEALDAGTAGGRSEGAGKMPPWGRENASRGSNEATNKGEECILTMVPLLLWMIQRPIEVSWVWIELDGC